ncbi:MULTISPECIES: dihydrolipoyl dehydrogenase family protein [Bizionia]|uniref:NAD(P)/FAD-dependent oxidoreductase n=1 Tax=Bizionia algoritergicola TaxID=291187 RepID=A0A5D0R2G0_9FLAO|nr:MULTISPECIES: NAD(P)/FAD-dependent oxidoreductase [Bizionia]OBX24265.1 pyridine nucleotide-disulfide oxidoreductase [Bizionia sp. APA-3]TYB75185.1 NAD(P)/FAD-dependent oxidoreductase [Bizionia algoritergicola]
MKNKHYNVFVIGSGIAGQTAAKICRENNLSVAISDNREFGGTCANRGCDSKKILLQFSQLVYQSNKFQGLGVKKNPKLNWKQVQKFRRSFSNPIPPKTEQNLKDLGMSLYHQSPKFISKNEVEVEGKVVSADYFVIATGNIPRPLDIDGNEFLKVSEDVLDLKKIPKSITFIGSGYIAMEFACMLATLGSQVTILEREKTALANFDQFLVEKLITKLESLGVKFIFNADVTGVKKLKKNLEVSFSIDGEVTTHKSRLVINAAGRVPAIEALDLEKADIEADHDGIVVNDYLQSKSHSKVYACGDVSNKSLALTPLSGLQGYIAGNNIIKENSKTFDVPCIPSTVFTTPNLSSVGYGEEDAKARYKNIKVYQGDASNWFNAKKENEDTYAYTILVNERTDEIVGAHILSSEANESINVFATAIYNKMTVKEFKRMVFTYPSYVIDLKSMMEN